MTAVSQDQNKIAALARIKSLWEEAEKITAPEGDTASSSRSAIMQRIDILMHDAENLTPQNNTSPAGVEEAEHLPSEDDIIDELAARVETAANSGTGNVAKEDFASVKTRMEAVSRLQPSHQDNSQLASPEYAFGDAFSTLIRHVVRQYINDEFEDVMRQAIKSELTRQNWEVNDTGRKSSPKKRKK